MLCSVLTNQNQVFSLTNQRRGLIDLVMVKLSSSSLAKWSVIPDTEQCSVAPPSSSPANQSEMSIVSTNQKPIFTCDNFTSCSLDQGWTSQVDVSNPVSYDGNI